jgi:hypothetical protein
MVLMTHCLVGSFRNCSTRFSRERFATIWRCIADTKKTPQAMRVLSRKPMSETLVDRRWGLFNESLRSNAPFLAAASLHIAVAVVVANAYGFAIDLRLYDGFTFVVAPFMGFIWIAAASLVVLARNRPERPAAAILNAAAEWQIGRRLAFGIPVIVVAPAFFAAFSSIKISLSLIVPFYADPWLAELDRLIHGGDAWRLLHPLLGYAPITVAIDFLYGLWMFAFYAVLFGVTFMVGNDALRARYLLAFVLTWALLGNVAATALSSVGPCFYAAFYRVDPYAELLAYLRSLPIVTVETQRMLMANHQAGQVGAGLGISAMPSLHVGVAFLNVLFAWHFGRVWRWLSTGFFVVILVGSVHLGWHYAVDGYVSIAAVIALWWASGAMVGLLYSKKPSL